MLTHKKTATIKLSNIKLPHQWDKDLDQSNVDTIAASFKALGQITPVTVDMAGMLRSGRHRYAAAKAIGMASLRCEVLHAATENEARAASLFENLARREIGTAERVRDTTTLVELLGAPTTAKRGRPAVGAVNAVTEIAKATGRSRNTVKRDIKIGTAIGPDVGRLEEAGVTRSAQEAIADLPEEVRAIAIEDAITDAKGESEPIDTRDYPWEDAGLRATYEDHAAAISAACLALGKIERDLIAFSKLCMARRHDRFVPFLAVRELRGKLDAAAPEHPCWYCKHADLDAEPQCQVCRGVGYISEGEHADCPRELTEEPWRVYVSGKLVDR